MEAIQQSFHQMMATFHQRLDTIEVQIPSAKSPHSSDSLAAEFASFKTFVIATFRAVQQQISILAQQIDHREMRSRRKILLIHGLPEEQHERTNELVSKVLSERLKIENFTTVDITRCHRMGRVSEDRSRPVLFKLRDASLREKIWSSKSSLKNSGVTLSEFLTKTRHDLFMKARQRFGITKCWTREGNIYVIGPDGARNRVNSMDDLAAVQPAKDPSATPQHATTSSTTSKAQATVAQAAVAGVKNHKAARPRRDARTK